MIDFFSKCEEMFKKLHICSYLLKKSLMKNLIFCDSILEYQCEIGMEGRKSYNFKVSLNVYLISSEYRTK